MDQSNETRQKLLVVEDDLGLQSQLKWCFDEYDIVFADDYDSAVAIVSEYRPPVVTLDLGLPPDVANVSVGFKVLDAILNIAPETKIIVITGNDDRENAIMAIAKGAYDFYQKPIDIEVLKIIIRRAFHVHALEMDNQSLLKSQITNPLEGLMTASPAMLKVCRTIEKTANANAAVLVLGESGTGKEVVARAMHNLSAQKNGRFVPINCAAIPENLLESELFGYEKGAFTGAVKRTIGKIEYANHGTLFLDEIGDLPMPLQAKLLRFLQERVVERLGGREEIPVDVRVVCATHQDIAAMIKAGTFREDLYYRLSEIVVQLPPLRDRGDDAVLLAKAFLQKYAEQNSRKIKSFTKDALFEIRNYTWPGNIRELENKVKRAVILTDGVQIGVEDMDLPSDVVPSLNLTLKDIRDKAELAAITKAMQYSENNISMAADILGVTRPTLYDLLSKHKITVEKSSVK